MTERDETAIEADIQAAGATAPRLTPADIDATILSTHVFRASDAVVDTGLAGESLRCLTIALLILRNGFVVQGFSACASPENYDAEIGAKVAVANAREKIWQLEGYLLKQRLYEANQLSLGLQEFGA